jgi:hypothetical protein
MTVCPSSKSAKGRVCLGMIANEQKCPGDAWDQVSQTKDRREELSSRQMARMGGFLVISTFPTPAISVEAAVPQNL